MILRLCFLFIPLTLIGQYAVDWNVVSGGGGTSGGGRFTVEGTVGQAVVGTQTGGRYTLESGYWSLMTVVSTPGAPQLTIRLEPTAASARIVWPQPAAGWELQWTDTLQGAETQWTTQPGPYENTDTDVSVMVDVPVGQRFYRLQK